jgi:hypothetical protein
MSTDDPSNTLPAPRADPPPVCLISLRPMTKGSLRAFVDIEIVRAGLILRNCAWFRHADGREWIALPSQRYEGSDGLARFTPLVEFAPSASEARRRFQQATLDAIHVVMAVELEADR